MIKWLYISLLVLLVFLIILFGFGILLHDNEQQHEAYNRQLEANKQQQKHPNSQSASTDMATLKTASVEPKKSVNLAIVAQNLTCVSNEQCKVADIDFVDLTCKVAVNTIGASQLKKASRDKTAIGRCDHHSNATKAVCVDNFCTLAASN